MRVTGVLSSWQVFLMKELPQFRHYAAILTGSKDAADRAITAALRSTMRPVHGEMSEAVLQVMHGRILRSIGEHAVKEPVETISDAQDPVVSSLRSVDYNDRQAYALVQIMSLPAVRAATIMTEQPHHVHERIARVKEALAAAGKDCPNPATPSRLQAVLHEVPAADAESSAPSSQGLTQS